MKFGGKIRGWYKKNRRELPWRQTRDPFRIWISEIILQQTRISQGIDYYEKFVTRFPDVTSLASAGEDEVLKLWQGLGYYSRARNLHSAAKDVVENMKGKIPQSYQGLLELKGVGAYTAAAISSICFGESRAVVDGNVSRVIARLYGIEDPVNATRGSQLVNSLAGKLLEEGVTEGDDPGMHNQAMMEFGALQCVPLSPNCGECPLAEGCDAFNTRRVEKLPVKIPKKKPVDRWMYFYIIHDQKNIILVKRSDNDIWKSLYQFPMAESAGSTTKKEMVGSLFIEVLRHLKGTPDPTIKFRHFSEPILHQLTHRTIHAHFIHVEMTPLPSSLPDGTIAIPMDHLEKYAVPRLIERYMESAKFSYL